MKFPTGSLVSFRGREWVVLPPKDEQSLLLKPLGGTEAEIACAFPGLEKIDPASFPPPNPQAPGDARSCALLRDAVKLGLRATTGPFRSFGHIAVDPRPYQLVPLLLAMRQDPIRLLIADDVGIGKTIEALLIAREMLDRGEISRICVLCPPQLAEQWQKEMAEKFHLEAELVLPSTVARLERGLGATQSIFEKFPITVVSLDFIKTEKRRNEFFRACPEFVIIDEAHACALGGKQGKQRYNLVRNLAEDPNRHMLFVTATPHSGKEDVFRSLLALLNPTLASLPEDLSGSEHEKDRKFLAEYFVQRRRGDIRAYLDEKTPFPERKTQELTWQASDAWKELFKKTLAVARQGIENEAESSIWRQRLSWWSAIALLRAVSSSPAAALQTLGNRTRPIAEAAQETSPDAEAIDAVGRQLLYDDDSGEEGGAMDCLPEADQTVSAKLKRHLAELAAMAKNLTGENDAKLQALLPHLKKLLEDGFSPVIFCRFIPTAQYLAAELRKAFPECEVAGITGQLPPEAREEGVTRLASHAKRILVCTDCLSEGINLQENFNAVIHYDLSWNPTRHEQREGRADRFGQSFPEVRCITWYGTDNPMDGMILDVLLRKHEAIRKSLGISVPVPEDLEKVMETLLKGLLLRKRQPQDQSRLELPGIREFSEPEKERLAAEWDKIKAREEKRTKAFFAQHSIKTFDVAHCLAETEAAGGGPAEVERFVLEACPLLGGTAQQTQTAGRVTTSLSFDDQARSALPDLPLPENGRPCVFRPPAKRGELLLSRTHPFVERLGAWLAESTLDSETAKILPRCGAMRTSAVQSLSTLLLCRFRFEIATTGAINHSSLAEECVAIAFEGPLTKATRMPLESLDKLFTAKPASNVPSDIATVWLEKAVNALPGFAAEIAAFQQERAEALLTTHRNARDASKKRNLRYKVTPQGQPDILGIFIYLPQG